MPSPLPLRVCSFCPPFVSLLPCIPRLLAPSNPPAVTPFQRAPSPSYAPWAPPSLAAAAVGTINVQPKPSTEDKLPMLRDENRSLKEQVLLMQKMHKTEMETYKVHGTGGSSQGFRGMGQRSALGCE